MKKILVIAAIAALTLSYVAVPSLNLGETNSGILMVLLAALVMALLFTLVEETYGDALDGLKMLSKGVTGAGKEIGVAGKRVTKKGVQVTYAPIKVLELPIKTSYQKMLEFIGKFGLVVLLTAFVLFLPTPEGLSEQGHAALALFVFTASILSLEPVSLPIAALMVPVAGIALGVGDAEAALRPFSRPVVFLILGSLFLAEAVRKHGLARRMALITIVKSKGNMRQILLGIMVTAGVLSMWIENTATAAILIPVALTISQKIPVEKEARRVLTLLVFGIAVAASVGGMGTIMGASSNAVASGLLRDSIDWTFVDWMKFGLPAFILILPLSWVVLIKIIKVETKEIEIEHIRDELEKIGPLDSKEKEVLLVLVGAAFLWITGSYIEELMGLPKTLLSSAVVAIIAVAFLSIRNVINWEDLKGVSWGVFLIIGAGLTLGESLTRTGATTWFAGVLQPSLSTLSFLTLLIFLCTVSALLTNVLNNTTIAAVFVPILISVAMSTGEDPIKLVIPATLATTFGYSLPSASGRMALIAATGLITREDMLKYGILITLPSVAALVAMFYGMTLLGVI